MNLFPCTVTREWEVDEKEDDGDTAAVAAATSGDINEIKIDDKSDTLKVYWEAGKN